MNEERFIGITTAFIVIVVIAVILVSITNERQSQPFSYCNSWSYDPWKCKAEHVDKCVASERFTREECVVLEGK